MEHLIDVYPGDTGGLLEAIPHFCSVQAQRCLERGIRVWKFPISHVALRTRTWRDYIVWRDALEPLCSGNLENVWNGRPISKLMLVDQPVVTAPHDSSVQRVPLIELIPPFHQRVYRMGLEHVGYVVGDGVDAFGRLHHEELTGQQFQGPVNSPYYALFPDYTHVKFYRWSLGEVCIREGNSFRGFSHADWQPADDLAGPYESS
ncbi:VOC family protein [Streptomyces sp. NPDC057271]|uniref:VOC family protein n=1 Tax=unclassified Streptomyces TaxID=2593676 RepID=UPI00362BE269